MQRLKVYWPVLLVFGLALLVRVVYNLTAADGYIPKYDARLYEIIAQHLIDNHHCFCLFSSRPTVSRAPLWPWIIAAIYNFTGPQNIYPRLFYSLLGSGTCIVIYLWARDLFGRRIALVTGIIAAIYVGLFLYDGWLFSESLYTFLSTTLVYTLYRVQIDDHNTFEQVIEEVHSSKRHMKWLLFFKKQRWVISAGLLVGLASLTRPNGPMLYGLLFLWGGCVIFFRGLAWKSVLKSVLIISCISLILILPWTYRNYRATHELTLVATGMGEVLAGAYNDTILVNNPVTGPGYWVSRDKVSPPLLDAQKKPHHDSFGYTGQDEKSDIDQALDWIRTHSSALPMLVGWHFMHMWQPYTLEPGLPIREFPNRLASQIVWYLLYGMSIPVFLMAGTGLIVTWQQKKRQLTIVYLTLGLTVLQNIALYANMRFRAPIEPLLVLMVGSLIWWINARIKRYSEGKKEARKLG